MYFKITNAKENHNGFQYKTGLNVLDKKFELVGSCVPGGLYFTSVEFIFDFLTYGIYLREISLPTEDPDFEMIEDPSGDKWRANKIILGKRFDLDDPSTYEYLISHGADHVIAHQKILELALSKNDWKLARLQIISGASPNNYCLIDQIAKNRDLDLLKFIFDEIDPHCRNCLFQRAAFHGFLDMIKFLLEKGINPNLIAADINVKPTYGYMDVIKYFTITKTDFKVNNFEAIIFAAENGHLDVVSFLFDRGAKIKAINNKALITAAARGNLSVVKFFVVRGVDHKYNNNAALAYAHQYGHKTVIKYLTGIQ